ncbi:glycosyltransferase family 2 protein [Candidatus Azambacteria bacterium]|nr:glycosyltransferase family 2 protein [Candidatus Azambacteria bacterium]
MEIQVVDNASQDGSADFVAAKHPDVRLIRNAKNLGYAGGHNIGIREAEGEYVLLVNQDTVLTPTFIECAVETFRRDGRIGAVQGKLFLYNFNDGAPRVGLTGKRLIDTTGFLFLKNRRVLNRGQGEEESAQYNQGGEVFGADGALPIYRRAALEDVKIGTEYFDEDFFAYMEDVDLAWRLRLRGWKTWYEPRAIAFHGRGAGERAVRNYFSILRERRHVSPFAKKYSFRNKRLLQMKNEFPSLAVKHLFWWGTKEILAWAWATVAEWYTPWVAKELIRLAPKMFKKRREIMRRATITPQAFAKWIT